MSDENLSIDEKIDILHLSILQQINMTINIGGKIYFLEKKLEAFKVTCKKIFINLIGVSIILSLATTFLTNHFIN